MKPKTFGIVFRSTARGKRLTHAQNVFRGGGVLAGRYKNFMHKKSGILTYLTYLQTLHRNFEEVVVKDGWS